MKIAEIKLNVGSLVYHVPASFPTKEVAEVRAQVLEAIGKAFDRSIQQAKAKKKGAK